MKNDQQYRELRAALVAKHGDLVPVAFGLIIRRGWYPLVDKMMTETTRKYPSVRFNSIRGYSGWLRIDHTVSGGGVLERAEIGKHLQGYITESTWTCEECGSNHGEHWQADDAGLGSLGRHHDRVICGACLPEFELDFRETMPAIILKTMNITPSTISH